MTAISSNLVMPLAFKTLAVAGPIPLITVKLSEAVADLTFSLADVLVDAETDFEDFEPVLVGV